MLQLSFSNYRHRYKLQMAEYQHLSDRLCVFQAKAMLRKRKSALHALKRRACMIYLKRYALFVNTQNLETRHWHLWRSRYLETVKLNSVMDRAYRYSEHFLMLRVLHIWNQFVDARRSKGQVQGFLCESIFTGRAKRVCHFVLSKFDARLFLASVEKAIDFEVPRQLRLCTFCRIPSSSNGVECVGKMATM